MESLPGARHHTIVVVDVEGFGDRRRTNPHQRAVRDGLYEIVESAFAAVGVPWRDCYHEDRGDAVFILAPASTAKAVFVEALPPTLVTALRVHNDTHPEQQRIRLRMALHAGEVNYDAHGVTSSSLTLAFRLIDAAPLKAALAASPGVLAVIASGWFFDDVVRHSPGAAPATWRPVEVAEKETLTVGWITLPDHPYPPDAARLTAPPATHRHRAGALPVPRQLPLAVPDFTGRAEHLAALDALIPSDPDPIGAEAAQAVVISAVDGTAGIGKTTLAPHWAHQAQHRFPDGTLHVNLRGYGPGDPATPAEILDGFLHALDTPAQRMPVGVDAQAALYRSLLAGRRMLIVLDNASSADQVRPLLPGTPGCMVLVTSRDSLTGLVVTDAARRLTLDLLTPPEALTLVTGIIGTDRTAAEPGATTELIRLCARLPLALRIAAGRVAAHPHTTVAEIVTELADDRYRLDALSRSGDEKAAVRAVFAWSYQRLNPAQARFEDALVYLHQALSLSRGADTGRLEAVVEDNLGRAYAGLGRYQHALEHGERSLELRRHVGDRIGETYALCSIARARQGLGQHQRTIALCRDAIAIGHECRAPVDVAESLDTLAVSLHHTGDTAEAIACWREAAVLLTAMAKLTVPHKSETASAGSRPRRRIDRSTRPGATPERDGVDIPTTFDEPAC